MRAPILVSAGHYPVRPGAMFEDFVEHHEAVIWRDRVVSLLGPLAAPVPVGFLHEKVEYIKANLPKLAVEIHFNDAQTWVDKNGDAAVQPDELMRIGRGSETLYYPGSVRGKQSAEVMQDSLTSVFPPNRGAVEGYYRRNPAKGADFFLKIPGCICLIVEPEFVRNAEKILAYRQEGCAAVAEGLRQALALLERRE